MEKVIKNDNKIAYVVSSGNYHRKVYQNGSSYVLKSYSETKVDYTVSAFRTYNASTSRPASVYVVDTMIRSCTYSTYTRPNYSSSTSGAAGLLSTARYTRTLYTSQQLNVYRQSNAPTSVSHTSAKNGIISYHYQTSVYPASYVRSQITAFTQVSGWKKVIEVIAPITPNISSISATFTSSANDRTYYTTDNYVYTFDAEFYGNAYTDVAAAYSSKTSAYSSHWTRFGYSEYRIPNSKGFFVLSTSFGGFTTTTSGSPKRIVVFTNPGAYTYFTRITSGTRLSRVTVTSSTVVLSLGKRITTVWNASESIISQFTYNTTSTIDNISRTY
jgi:hypothetical protein